MEVNNMRSYRSERHFVHQLCGNWDTRIEINDAEKERAREESFKKKREKEMKRREVLVPYCSFIKLTFRDTTISRDLDELVDTWAKHQYNKELFHAALQVKNLFVQSNPVVEVAIVNRYNKRLKAMCLEQGIQHFDVIKI